MNNKLICPFCQQELKPQTMDGEWLECWNCSYHEPSHHPFPQRILCGTKELWQELIRTRKELDDILGKHEKLLNHIAVRANREQELRNKLDIAVDVLKLFDSGQYTLQPDSYGLKTDASRLARKALEQITALEQKDVK